MAFPEQPIQPSESSGHDPHPAGDSSGSIDQPGDYNPEPDIDWHERLKSLADESRNPQLLYDFENKLAKAGYLPMLEESGVLSPIPQDPNPHVDIEANLLWALGHRDEVERWMRAVEQREATLRYLYIGAVLGASLDYE